MTSILLNEKGVHLKDVSPTISQHLESHFGGLLGEYQQGLRTSPYYDLKCEIDMLNKAKAWTENDVDRIVTAFFDGLIADLSRLNDGQTVSDLGYFAPRRSNVLKKIIAGKIALKLYPPTDDSDEALIKCYIWYQSALSRLSRHFKEQEFNKVIEREKYKISRLDEFSGLWNQLKEAPLSQEVLEPTAMPVEISDESDFEPIFDFLSQNRPVVKGQEGEVGATWDEKKQCYRFKRGAVYADNRMDLCKMVVGPNPSTTTRLMQSLARNSTVEHFLLGNNVAGIELAKAIRCYFETATANDNEACTKMKTWYLAGNDLTAECMRLIVEGLCMGPAGHPATALQELWLKRNPLKAGGMLHVSTLLMTTTSLVTLDLHNTGLLNDGLAALCPGLAENHSLRNLYLEANGISIVTPLVEYFTNRAQEGNGAVGVTSLWLGMNCLGDEGAAALCDCLQNVPWLKGLYLGSNMITEAACENVYRAFRQHNSIVALDLGMYKSSSDMKILTNRIQDAGLQWVCKLLSENSSLQYMSVISNGITMAGIKQLAVAIEKNKSLFHCEFGQVQFGKLSEEEATDSSKQLIRGFLERNRLAAGGDAAADPKAHCRFLKHGRNIVNIESIYRTTEKNVAAAAVASKRAPVLRVEL